MFETLFEKTPALFIPVASVVGSSVVFTVWIIAHYWHAVRRQELEAAMKQDMLNRGFSAPDIERVLLASTCREDLKPEKTEVVSDNEYYLIEKMLDEGHAVE